MNNSKIPWKKAPGNRPSHFQCLEGYNIGSVNSGGTTEGAANLELIVKAVNEHAALVAVAEAAKAVQMQLGQVPFMKHQELYAAWSDLTNCLAAVRAGSEVAK